MMAKLVFQPPSGPDIEQPSVEFLRRVILAPPEGFWRQGSGGATLVLVDQHVRREMLILPNAEFGIYLHWFEGKEEWLSLEDPERLEEVAECSDEWYASIGLFLPREKAWLAVKEFCETGGRTEKVDWIRPSQVPETGNW